MLKLWQGTKIWHDKDTFPGYGNFLGYGRPGIKTCRNPGNWTFPGYGKFLGDVKYPGYGNYPGYGSSLPSRINM